MPIKKKLPTEKEIIDALDKYRTQLYESDRVSATKFSHMQTALHWAKNIVRNQFGSNTEGDVSWVKN